MRYGLNNLVQGFYPLKIKIIQFPNYIWWILKVSNRDQKLAVLFKIHVLLQKVTTPYAVSGFGWFKMKGFYFGNFWGIWPNHNNKSKQQQQ